MVEALNRSANTALQSPDLRSRLTKVGAEPGGGTPEDLAAFMKKDAETWARVVKAANVKADNDPTTPAGMVINASATESCSRSGLEVREVPPPARPGSGEVMIKVEATGICGTDVHIAEWTPGYELMATAMPVTLGHEFAGTVIEVGSRGRYLARGLPRRDQALGRLRALRGLPQG